MAKVSKTAQYAIRAALELAQRRGNAPVHLDQIATAQAAPRRFLKGILSGLVHAGLVESRRGAQGGYVLSGAPETVTVQAIIETFDGPLSPVDCELCGGSKRCSLRDECRLAGMWEVAGKALADVFGSVTLADLVGGQLVPGSGPTVVAPPDAENPSDAG
jgi:Rrf2 family protein